MQRHQDLAVQEQLQELLQILEALVLQTQHTALLPLHTELVEAVQSLATPRLLITLATVEKADMEITLQT